jgi:hypothetical protein
VQVGYLVLNRQRFIGEGLGRRRETPSHESKCSPVCSLEQHYVGEHPSEVGADITLTMKCQAIRLRSKSRAFSSGTPKSTIIPSSGH